MCLFLLCLGATDNPKPYLHLQNEHAHMHKDMLCTTHNLAQLAGLYTHAMKLTGVQ